MAKVEPIPEGNPRVIPYLHVDGAHAAIEFHAKVLGATERISIPAPGGKIGHAELEIGDSVIMLADEFPDMNVRGPKAIGGTPVTVMVYVEDVDQAFERAIAGGSKVMRPVMDQFYGDRSGEFEDPFTAGASPRTSRTSYSRTGETAANVR